MEPQQPYQGFSPSTYGAAPAYVAAPVPVAEHLRPLSTGEILDRTLAQYRRNFWLFAGIGAIPAAVSTLSSVVRVILVGTSSPWLSGMASTDPTATRRLLGSQLATQAYSLPLLLLFVLACGVAKAAAAHAVLNLRKGERPAAMDCYRAVGNKWLRWGGIVLRQYWSLLWPIAAGTALWSAIAIGGALTMKGNQLAIGALAIGAIVFLLLGVVLGVLNYLRVALAEVAGVAENLGVNASVRRSRALVQDRKGRIFLIVLLVYVLFLVAGGLQLPFVLAAGELRGLSRGLLLAGGLVVGFVSTALVLPIASIAFAHTYVDERVRREGYDIELLMQRSAAAHGTTEI